MIKITMNNGTLIETDSIVEAVEVLNSNAVGVLNSNTVVEEKQPQIKSLYYDKKEKHQKKKYKKHRRSRVNCSYCHSDFLCTKRYSHRHGDMCPKCLKKQQNKMKYTKKFITKKCLNCQKTMWVHPDTKYCKQCRPKMKTISIMNIRRQYLERKNTIINKKRNGEIIRKEVAV